MPRPFARQRRRLLGRCKWQTAVAGEAAISPGVSALRKRNQHALVRENDARDADALAHRRLRGQGRVLRNAAISRPVGSRDRAQTTPW